MQDKNETIEGFYFEDEDVARKAMKEYMYIEKMKDRVAGLKPDALKDFYEKLLEKQIFSTQVGYTYLYEIRSTLVESFHVQPEELTNIVIPTVRSIARDDLKTSEKASDVKEKELLSLKRTRTLLSVSVVLLIAVIIGFFIILSTNQNIGYINTENKILDKYAGWQEQLDAREQALDERERALNELENTSENIDITTEESEPSDDSQESGDNVSVTE